MEFKVTDDNKFLRLISASPKENAEIRLRLEKRIKNWRFHPLVKKGLWDGRIKFIDQSGRIPIGLWQYTYEQCKEMSCNFEVDGLERIMDTDFDEEDFDKFVENLFETHPKIKPRDYQIEAAKKILKAKRCAAELATNAGKTLMTFLIFAYLKERNKIRKMLVIVPRESLVIQLIEDFEDYSQDKKVFQYRSQLLGGGRDKLKEDVDIIVGTYQTLCKLNSEFFEEIDAICIDESQSCNAKSVKDVLGLCSNAEIKFGISGTTKIKNDASAESLTMMALTGPLVEKISSAFLTDNSYATPINLKMIFLKYLDEKTKTTLLEFKRHLNHQKNQNKQKGKSSTLGSKLLAYENKIVTDDRKRMLFVVNLISKLPKNSLILFRDIKTQYGRRLYSRLKDVLPDNYEVFYVDGGTDEENRQFYKEQMDVDDGIQKILIASFGTFSTGISINSIDNIVFTESYKSEVIIKQSIGRGMRKNKGKSVINIIDIVDDFGIRGYSNYTLRHASEREEIYKNEGYKYKKIKINL